MGFKTEAKARMSIGATVQIHVGQTEYEGVVEKNTLLNNDHNNVESDSVAVLRNDKRKEHYIIPLGSKLGIVMVCPFKEQNGSPE